MAQTILVKDPKNTHITCQNCKKVHRHDVTQFMGVDTHVKIRCRCTCGHTFYVVLERRLYARKPVSLPAKLHIKSHGYRLSGTITDISQSGVRVELDLDVPLNTGMMAHISFHLDDRDTSFIEKNITFRTVKNTTIGAEFDTTTHYGKLGPYIEFR